MSYFCAFFKYQPIKMFLNSNAADVVQSRGDITLILEKHSITDYTIGYVSLNKLTIPNTNYNSNSSNNILLLTNSDSVQETFEITPGN